MSRLVSAGRTRPGRRPSMSSMLRNRRRCDRLAEAALGGQAVGVLQQGAGAGFRRPPFRLDHRLRPAPEARQAQADEFAQDEEENGQAAEDEPAPEDVREHRRQRCEQFGERLQPTRRGGRLVGSEVELQVALAQQRLMRPGEIVRAHAAALRQNGSHQRHSPVTTSPSTPTCPNSARRPMRHARIAVQRTGR